MIYRGTVFHIDMDSRYRYIAFYMPLSPYIPSFDQRKIFLENTL
jgi:hypothetical protein